MKHRGKMKRRKVQQLQSDETKQDSEYIKCEVCDFALINKSRIYMYEDFEEYYDDNNLQWSGAKCSECCKTICIWCATLAFNSLSKDVDSDINFSITCMHCYRVYIKKTMKDMMTFAESIEKKHPQKVQSVIQRYLPKDLANIVFQYTVCCKLVSKYPICYRHISCFL